MQTELDFDHYQYSIYRLSEWFQTSLWTIIKLLSHQHISHTTLYAIKQNPSQNSGFFPKRLCLKINILYFVTKYYNRLAMIHLNIHNWGPSRSYFMTEYFLSGLLVYRLNWCFFPWAVIFSFWQSEKHSLRLASQSR